MNSVKQHIQKYGDKWILGIIFLLGISLRITVYLQNRSFFLDESNVCLIIAENSYSDFFGQLEQFAPPFWLCTIKLFVDIFGHHEFSYRLFPLLLGCGSIFLFYWISRKLIQQKIPLLFIQLFFAFKIILVRYATETKQYGSDAFITLLLIYFALQLPKGKISTKNILLWMLLGGFSIWFSMPSIFILVGVGCWMLYQTFNAENAQAHPTIKKITPLFIIGGFWLLQFGIYFFIILFESIQAPELQDYHQDYFLPLIPLDTASLQQWWRLHYDILLSTIGVTGIAIGTGILFLLNGCFYLLKNKKGFSLLFFIPLLTCWLASGLEKYALWPRLALFYMPISLLILGMGSDFIYTQSNPIIKKIFVLLFILVISHQWGYKYFSTPLEIDEIKPVLQFVQTNAQGEELLYLNQAAVSPFRFYTEYHKDRNKNFKLQQHPVFFTDWNRLELKPDLSNVDSFWYINAHTAQDELIPLFDFLKQDFTISKNLQSHRAEAYLFVRK